MSIVEEKKLLQWIEKIQKLPLRKFVSYWTFSRTSCAAGILNQKQLSLFGPNIAFRWIINYPSCQTMCFVFDGIYLLCVPDIINALFVCARCVWRHQHSVCLCEGEQNGALSVWHPVYLIGALFAFVRISPMGETTHNTGVMATTPFSTVVLPVGDGRKNVDVEKKN